MDGVGPVELCYKLRWIQLFSDSVTHFLGQGQLLILFFREFRVNIVSDGKGFLERPYSEIAALGILGLMLVFEATLDEFAAIKERMFFDNVILVDLWDRFICLEPSLLHDIGVALAVRKAICLWRIGILRAYFHGTGFALLGGTGLLEAKGRHVHRAQLFESAISGGICS